MANIKKVMFFFGAGAEGKGNYGLPSGYEYLKKSLFGNEFQKDILEALKKYFANEYFNGKYKYSSHTYSNATMILRNIIKAKIEMDYEFLIRHKKSISVVLQDADFSELCENEEIKTIIDENKLGHIKGEKDESDRIYKEFKELLITEKKRQDISDVMLKDIFEKDSKGNAIIDMNIGMGGMFDSYFHTIISPSKYGKHNFSKVFNYYWMCYFTIIESIVFRYKNRDARLDNYVENNKLNYYKILSEIARFSRILNELDLAGYNEKTYYQIIRELFEKEIDYIVSGVATTNYFHFGELINGEAVYLNGKSTMFEFPELLEVRDVTVDDWDPQHIFMPFIFGQSHVKPIVHKYQIKQFKMFSDQLKESDILVILGFNMNEDDNHINTFIHEFVKSGKRLIVVGTADESTGKKDISSKIKCDESEVKYCSVTYGNNEQVVNTIINYIKNKEE